MLSLLFPFVAEPPYLSSLALPLNRIDDAVGPSAKVSTRKKVSNLTGSRQICICHSKMGSFCLLTFVDDEEGDKNQLDVFSILPVIYILLPSLYHHDIKYHLDILQKYYLASYVNYMACI